MATTLHVFSSTMKSAHKHMYPRWAQYVSSRLDLPLAQMSARIQAATEKICARLLSRCPQAQLFDACLPLISGSLPADVAVAALRLMAFAAAVEPSHVDQLITTCIGLVAEPPAIALTAICAKLSCLIVIAVDILQLYSPR